MEKLAELYKSSRHREVFLARVLLSDINLDTTTKNFLFCYYCASMSRPLFVREDKSVYFIDYWIHGENRGKKDNLLDPAFIFSGDEILSKNILKLFESERKNLVGYNENSVHYCKKIHGAPPLSDLFTPKRIELISEILNYSNKKSLCATPASWIDAYNLVNEMREILGLTENPTYVSHVIRKCKRNRNRNRVEGTITLKAKWNNMTKKITVTDDSYKKYVNLLEILVGRMYRMIKPAATAMSSAYDKRGLFDSILENNISNNISSNIDTMLFCIIMAFNCSTQKLFTSESQIQGGLDSHTEAFYNARIVGNNSVNWTLVSSIMPTIDHLNMVPLENREMMLTKWIEIILFLKDQMKEIWEKGMKNAPRVNMLVPRGVNSTSWNCMVGAWNNGRRHIATICNSMNIDMIPFFKCMKCTAGDQMQYLCNGVVDPDVEVFKRLSDMQIYPWSALDGTITRDDLDQILENICIEVKVNPAKYKINKSGAMRYENMKIHQNTICGVPVGNLSIQMINLLKKYGAYGSTPWTGS